MCDVCIAQVRHKRQKWISTPTIDAAITEIYMKRLKTRCSQSLQQYADKIRWPKFALVQRASKLGLARTKEKPWSREELELLQKHLWKSDARISNLLYQNGFKRSPVAVHIKITRTGGRRERLAGEYFTANQLAGLFGCDNHRITRWIKDGWLDATQKGTHRTARNGGDMFVITPAAVRELIESHPTHKRQLRRGDYACTCHRSGRSCR